MGTLADLPETEPLNTSPIAQGDDAIRETRLAVKTTFAVEHDLVGNHKVAHGSTRPTGTNGRLFINDSTGHIEVYANGTWYTAAMPTFTSITVSPGVPQARAYTGPRTVVVTLLLPAGAGTVIVTTVPPYPRGIQFTPLGGNISPQPFVASMPNVTQVTVSLSGGSVSVTGYVLAI